MKALTVRNPWAWAIIYGGKDVENRSRPTSHRGVLAIHTAKTTDQYAENSPLILDAVEAYNTPVIPGELIRKADFEHLGMIIGTAIVTGCHSVTECRKPDGSLCSEWAQEGLWHWQLTRCVAYRQPQPAQGALGLWEWDPEDITAPTQIHAQEYSAIPFSFFCRCGYQSVGTKEDPALFEDHIRSVFA